jgi:hypothetical protein
MPPLPARDSDREMPIRGYDAGECIVYGAGRTVAMSRPEDALGELFEIPGPAFVHARLPTNNCYHFRIEAGSE